MSRNGAGLYVLPVGQPVVTGTTISSSVFNTLTSDLSNALTTSIATDGQSVVTANISFGGFKATGLGAATVNGDAVRYEQIPAMVVAQTGTAYVTAGTSTAYTLTPVPAITTYTKFQRFNVQFHVACGAAPQIAISGLAVMNLMVYNSAGAKVSLAAGQLALNMISDIEYDGLDVVVLDQLPIPADESVNLQAGTSYTYVAGDKGKLVTHNNAAAIAGTLPQAGTTGFAAGWWIDVQNTGVGSLTVTPTTSTVDGVSTLVLQTGQGARLVSNGTNYYTVRSALPLTYTSPAQTITPGGSLTLTHGLGVKPKQINLWLKCITADGNFAIGDEVLVNSQHDRQDGTPIGTSVRRTSTQILITFSSNANCFLVSDPTTGNALAITNTKWSLLVEAI